MVKFVALDAEDVRKADSYIPISVKHKAIQILSAGCVEQVSLKVEAGENSVRPMPPRWQENVLGKRLVMAYVLASLYLHKIDGEALFNKDNPEFSFSERQFDLFSQAYFNLEQFKRHEDPEIRSKAFAILADYRDFEKMLNAEIYNMLQSRNDLLSRLCMMMDMQVAPEALQAALSDLEKITQEANQELDKKKAWMDQVKKEQGA